MYRGWDCTVILAFCTPSSSLFEVLRWWKVNVLRENNKFLSEPVVIHGRGCISVCTYVPELGKLRIAELSQRPGGCTPVPAEGLVCWCLFRPRVVFEGLGWPETFILRTLLQFAFRLMIVGVFKWTGYVPFSRTLRYTRNKSLSELFKSVIWCPKGKEWVKMATCYIISLTNLLYNLYDQLATYFLWPPCYIIQCCF